jgi:hypothetical protein
VAYGESSGRLVHLVFPQAVPPNRRGFELLLWSTIALLLGDLRGERPGIASVIVRSVGTAGGIVKRLRSAFPARQPELSRPWPPLRTIGAYGGTVPLLQLATVEYSQDWRLIWRRDRNPTLTVQRDLIAGVLPRPYQLSSSELKMRAISNSCTRVPSKGLAVRSARDNHEFYPALRFSFGGRISQRL